MVVLFFEEGFKVEGDFVNFVVDEFIGINLVEYIGGKMVFFNFFYYDMRKFGILVEFLLFFDDVIGGFIVGCMIKLFEGEL